MESMNEIRNKCKNRWKKYFLNRGSNFDLFWKSLLTEKNRKIHFIMGLGFDSRTNEAIRKICEIKSTAIEKCTIITYEDNDHGKYRQLTEENKKNLEKILKLNNIRINYPNIQLNINNRISIERETVKKITNTDINNYTDIIIDISSMPRNIFFPLISKILLLIDRLSINNQIVNLHVIVTENSALDSIIRVQGLDERAEYIHGFGSIDNEKTTDYTKIWIPILGEGKRNQIEIIRKTIDPDETCPLLPFPAHDLKRGDRLVLEYSQLLNSDLNIDFNNIIYADEKNPFQVYRILTQTFNRYIRSFKLLHGCKIILSALSSKLLSIGVLLAAYEGKLCINKNIGVCHVNSLGHNIAGGKQNLYNKTSQNELFELFLTGEPYEE